MLHRHKPLLLSMWPVFCFQYGSIIWPDCGFYWNYTLLLEPPVLTCSRYIEITSPENNPLTSKLLIGEGWWPHPPRHPGTYLCLPEKSLSHLLHLLTRLSVSRNVCFHCLKLPRLLPQLFLRDLQRGEVLKVFPLLCTPVLQGVLHHVELMHRLLDRLKTRNPVNSDENTILEN